MTGPMHDATHTDGETERRRVTGVRSGRGTRRPDRGGRHASLACGLCAMLAGPWCTGVVRADASPAAAPGWPGPEIAAEINLEGQRDDGREAFDEPRRDTAAFESSLRVAASQTLGRGASMLVELELGTRHRDGRGDDEDEARYRIRQLRLQHESADETLRWRLGRQKLEDGTGFFVDSRLDGLRFTRRGERGRFDLSLTRDAWFESGTERRDDIVYNALGSIRIDGVNGSRWRPWVLHRLELDPDGSERSRATWAGLQGIVNLDDRVGYWFNAAARTGVRHRDDGDRTLGGHAVDAGLTWTFDRRFDPSITLGAARASGNRAGSDEDEGFRQSGLHSNEFRPSGRNRFRYLGEVIDPELANLEVLSAGVGARLDRHWAVDVLWHRYRQSRAEDRLRGTDLRYEPAGERRDLGDALDLVVGYRRSESLGLLGVAGLFDPGAAFADDPGVAWLARLEMTWVFAR